MGRHYLSIFLISILLAGCSGDPGENGSEKGETEPLPEKTAKGLEWIRSERDKATSTLKTKWRLKGKEAVERTTDKKESTLTITEPLIDYYPAAGNTADTIYMSSKKGVFRESISMVTFNEKCLIKAVDKEKNTALKMEAPSLEYDSNNKSLHSAGVFTLFSENVVLKGKDLLYLLEEENVTIKGGTAADVTVTGKDPEKKGIKEKNSMETGAPVIFMIKKGTMEFTGETAADSPSFFFTSGSALIEQDRTAKENTGEFTHVKAKGNIVFNEKHGEKRRVTCTILEYDTIKGEVVMTGDPVLTNKGSKITSSKITFKTDKEVFIFAKPFKIEKAPEK